MIFNYFKQKKANLPVPYRRINPAGGRVIAIIGVDGAGKSTITNMLRKSLTKKIDVYFEYLGSGDGKGSFFRAPLQLIKKVVIDKKTAQRKENASTNKNSEKLSISKAIWAVTLAFEKQIKIKRVWKAKARGMIVICDRYPQTKIMGINDGPLLNSWKDNPNFIKRKLSEWEFNIYKQASILIPDLLIKLIVDHKTSQKRKPLENPVAIEKKVKIIRGIQIPARYCATIDAAKPLDEVTKDVYSKISEII